MFSTSAAVRPARVVHAHVQRSVLGVGEPALAHVELHRGDAQVEQDRVDLVEPEVGEDVGDLVVDRVDPGEAVAEGAQPLAREPEGVRVAVDADHAGGRHPRQHRLGVAAEAEGGVDEHGVRRGRARGPAGRRPGPA